MPESKRQLAAIMFTDIVGYTRLMGENEEKAMQLLRKNRNLHKSIIKKHYGKWLKEMGDGTLASFKTTIDAVYCAGELLKACKSEDITLRIGVHQGEIVEENGDIFGDGVNVASRIEALAEPGQILISETAHNNVRNKPGITTTLVGKKELKNVENARTVYRTEVEETFFASRRKEEKKPLSSILIVSFALLLIAVGFTGYWLGTQSQDPPEKKPVIRYEINIGALLGRTGRTSLAFSPDGKYLCYVSKGQLYLKSLDDTDAGSPINGPVNPRQPIFSPDGKWIAYENTSAGNSLMKVPVTGGKTELICLLEGGGINGMNWYEDGILFAYGNAFYTVDANGGKPNKIFPITDERFELWSANPQILPDNSTIIYNQWDQQMQYMSVKMGQLGNDKEHQILIEQGRNPRYLRSGHIAYQKDATLQVVQFDLDSKKIKGQAHRLISDKIYMRFGIGQFAFNNHGTFVYFPTDMTEDQERDLAWIDMKGQKEKITKEPGGLLSPKISGNGQQIAVDLLDADGSYNIVIYNTALGTATNFITQHSSITPVWSPDNTAITYFQMEEPRGVFMKPVDQSYAPKLLFETDQITHLGNWSKDGRYLLFRSPEGIGYYDSEDGAVRYLDYFNAEDEFFYPSLSPDGKWLAYTSDDEENNDQLFVVPFPGPGQAHRVSFYEGYASVWAPDMKAIYFIGQDNTGLNVSRAKIETDPQFSSSEPEVLFYGDYTALYEFKNSNLFEYGNSGLFDIHPDGDRFLMQITHGTENSLSETNNKLKFVTNWTELLKE